MNIRSVERLLREKAAHLPQADFPLTISEIKQPIILKSKAAKARKVKPCFRIALAIISILICAFGVCFGASAEFRHTVMALFRANSPETVPSLSPASSTADNTAIHFIGKQNIGDIADVTYFDFGGYSVSNDVATIVQPDGEMRYYLLKGDGVEEIAPIVTRVTDTIEFDGRTLLLDFEYGTLNGQPFLQNRIGQNLTSEDNAFLSKAIAYYDENTVWIDASFGNQVLYNAYYLLYDLKTGAVSDVLAGIVPENLNIETIVISPDKQKLILKTFNGGWPGIYTYFDAAAKKTALVSELIGNEHVYDCSFADDNTLYIELYHNELRENITEDQYILSGYCYSLDTGIKIRLFDENDTLVYALQGTCILKENNQYKIINASGETYMVEGMDLGEEYSYLMNSEHTKIAILNFSNEKEESLGVSEIGIIDLTKKEIKTFDREGYNKNDEAMISWNDNSSLVITTSEHAFFLYRFK